MYYSKSDNIIYIPNPTEKLFLEKDFIDHVHDKGTRRYQLTNDWVVHQQYIELGENKFWLPISIHNGHQSFILDLKQELVKNANVYFSFVAQPTSLNPLPEELFVLVRPNSFFLILKVLQLWGNVIFMNDDTNFYLSSAAKIEDGKILHCKLIYFHSQRITL